MTSSTDAFYDDLAPFFREYAGRRAAYLSSIDRLVAPWLTGNSLLDVGAGDGVRAQGLALRAGLERLVMVEPSPAMASLCRRSCSCVHTIPIEEFHPPDQTFDNVTCLWNVLGHIRGFDARVAALRTMASLMTPGGSLHMDVHNRYNARSYGWTTLFRNLLDDFVHSRSENGEREFDLVFGSRKLHGRGYLFSPAEMARTIDAAGLRILDRKIVDYDNGVLHRTPFQGHLYFRLGPRNSTVVW